MELPIDAIRVGENLRQDLGDLGPLVQTIKKHGVLEPVLIDEQHRLIAGFRRVAAAKLAGLQTVPVHVRPGPISDQALIELRLVENAVRRDLQPLEAAAAYKQLVVEHGLSPDEVGLFVGRSRRHVQQYLSFLTDLGPEALEALGEGKLSPSNAQELCRLDFDIQRRVLPQACSLTFQELRQVVQRILLLEEKAAAVESAPRQPPETPGRRGEAGVAAAPGPAPQPAAGPEEGGDLYDRLLARGEPTLGVLLLDSLVAMVRAEQVALRAQNAVLDSVELTKPSSPDLATRVRELAGQGMELAERIVERAWQIAEACDRLGDREEVVPN